MRIEVIDLCGLHALVKCGKPREGRGDAETPPLVISGATLRDEATNEPKGPVDNTDADADKGEGA